MEPTKQITKAVASNESLSNLSMPVNDKLIENFDHFQIIKRASQETSLFLIEKVP